MDAHPSSGSTRLVVACLLLSVILAPFVLGRVLWDTSFFGDAVSSETARFLSFGGLLIAQPLGWLNVILANKILSKGDRRRFGRVAAIASIVVGVLGILTGLIWTMIAVFFRP